MNMGERTRKKHVVQHTPQQHLFFLFVVLTKEEKRRFESPPREITFGQRETEERKAKYTVGNPCKELLYSTPVGEERGGRIFLATGMYH